MYSIWRSYNGFFLCINGDKFPMKQSRQKSLFKMVKSGLFHAEQCQSHINIFDCPGLVISSNWFQRV